MRRLNLARHPELVSGSMRAIRQKRSARDEALAWILKRVQDDGRVILAFAFMLLASPVFAASNMPTAPLANVQLADAQQEAKAKALMETLRCLVCQGQSIADSNADLAADMRSLVRQRIQEGETPDQVRAWLVKRYGAWVSYEPPLGADTMVLWIAPLVLLVLGGVLARGSLRKRAR